MRYAIKVEEILRETYIVEADDLDAAIQKVEDAYDAKKIILTYDDYTGYDIGPSEYWTNGEVPKDADVRHYETLIED